MQLCCPLSPVQRARGGSPCCVGAARRVEPNRIESHRAEEVRPPPPIPATPTPTPTPERGEPAGGRTGMCVSVRTVLGGRRARGTCGQTQRRWNQPRARSGGGGGCCCCCCCCCCCNLAASRARVELGADSFLDWKRGSVPAVRPDDAFQAPDSRLDLTRPYSLPFEAVTRAIPLRLDSEGADSR